MAYRRSRLYSMWIVPAITLMSISGCTEENDGLGPGTFLQVDNVADQFRWQLSATVAVTQTLPYTWTTTGPVADVTQSGNVITGSGTIVVRDADGTEVYSRALNEAGAFQTAAGTVGDWTVVVTLSDVTAVTSFTVEIP